MKTKIGVIVLVLGLWLLGAPNVHAQVNGNTLAFTCATTAVQALPANGLRRGFLIQDLSATTSCYCTCGVTANPGASPPLGFQIVPGGNWETPPGAACTTAISCATISGSASMNAVDY